MDPDHFHTLCAHGTLPGPEPRTLGQPFVPPIAQTSIFSLGTTDDAEKLFAHDVPGYSYTRFGNPTVDHLASVLAALEGGQSACITASGNAAVLCALTMAMRGSDDVLLTHPDVYGGTRELLRILSDHYRVAVEIVRPDDAQAWADAVARATVVFVETPSNPLLRMLDLEVIAQQAHAAGAQLVVDNTVATPYNQQPFQHGADWVIHSASKYLNGHSDMIGGCVISRDPMSERHRGIHKNLGGIVNAMDAWLMLRGLRTLALRMDAHNRNGAAVADWLARHPSVERVYYPGLATGAQAKIYQKQMRAGGALLSMELKGGEDAAIRFLDRLRLIVHAVSLGGMESLATRPSATSHRGMSPADRQAAGATDGLVRLSVGVEALDDILADLDRALSLA